LDHASIVLFPNKKNKNKKISTVRDIAW
jgi:hypothetical protein